MYQCDKASERRGSATLTLTARHPCLRKLEDPVRETKTSMFRGESEAMARLTGRMGGVNGVGKPR